MRTALTVAALLCAPFPARTQDKAPPSGIELEKLRTPTSPAFTVLGVNPSVVARPQTPRALATELVSSSHRGSVIPNNYALEFAPYWLTPKPRLSFDDYLRPTLAQSLAQSFTISLATARPDTTDSLTQVAFGVRALPRGGEPSRRFKSLQATMDLLQDIRLDSLRRYLRATTAADSARLGRFLDANADSLGALARAMAGEERVGWFWELAAAVAAAFPGPTFESGRLARLGAWATATYRTEAPRLDFMAVGRLLHTAAASDQNAVDVGGRLHWSVGDLGISSEWISRTVFTVTTTAPAPGTTQALLTLTSSSRAVGIMDYRAAEEMYLTLSFGQDHKKLGQQRHPLVARFGMQLTYGDKPVVSLPER